MEVILREDFPSLGYVGDRVKVKAGYARNFLIPRGVAIEGSSRNAKLLGHKLAGIMAKRIKLKSEAELAATEMQKLTLEFTLKVGESGRSFGAVTLRDLEQAFEKLGHKIDRRRIRIDEPLKAAGNFVIGVRLHPEVVAQVPVLIRAETPAVVKTAPAAVEEAGEGKPAAKKRAPRKKKGADEAAATPDAVAAKAE